MKIHKFELYSIPFKEKYMFNNDFSNVKFIVPKNEICDFLNEKYKFQYKVKVHNNVSYDDEFTIENTK